MEGRFAIVEEKKALHMKEEQRMLRKERAAGRALPCLSFSKAKEYFSDIPDPSDDVDNLQDLEPEYSALIKEKMSKQRV